MAVLPVRKSLERLTKIELFHYATKHGIPVIISTSKTGLISRIMRQSNKSADQIRKDADQIIANR